MPNTFSIQIRLTPKLLLRSNSREIIILNSHRSIVAYRLSAFKGLVYRWACENSSGISTLVYTISLTTIPETATRSHSDITTTQNAFYNPTSQDFVISVENYGLTRSNSPLWFVKPKLCPLTMWCKHGIRL